MKKVALCVLDGWGLGGDDFYNAISSTSKPFLDYALKNYKYSELEASGSSVGLFKGQMGNSEVGHLAIGSGRVVSSNLVRATSELKNLNNNKNFLNFIDFLKKNNSYCNLVGLLSDGGVHSHIDHLKEILSYLIKNTKLKLNLHLFLDGRDVLPKSALSYIFDDISIKTISGRYYGMDRDRRFERTDKAFFSILHGKSEDNYYFDSSTECINYFYNKKISDEFIPPSIIKEYEGIKKNDGILFFNFRADRVNQLLSKFIEYEEKLNLKILGLTQYSKKYKISSIIPEIEVKNTLGEILSVKGIKQLRIAETEKYAHVTYFFNAKRETPFKGEDRILVNSLKVPTYNLKPEMSAFEITDKFLENYQKYQFVLINYANADMVGHTGDLEAAKVAVKVLDQNLQKLYDAFIQNNEDDNTLIITADHGNAEVMYDKKSGQPHTAHTTNKVPFILINKKLKKCSLRDGELTDIAPTILSLLGVSKNNDITGTNLIVNK